MLRTRGTALVPTHRAPNSMRATAAAAVTACATGQANKTGVLEVAEEIHCKLWIYSVGTQFA